VKVAKSKKTESQETREELSEIQRKKSEVIFGLPELEKDLKTAVFDKLNKVTPTSMEEIKFIRKIGKASNGKIQPTLAWWCSEVQQSVKSSSRGPTKSQTVLNPVSQKTNKCTRKTERTSPCKKLRSGRPGLQDRGSVQCTGHSDNQKEPNPGLKVLYANLRSLKNKLHDVEALLQETEPRLAVFTK
jgi:hypothetical protein